MHKKTNYSLCFLFDDNNNILLQKKTKENFQKNTFNGVGRDVKYGETPRESITSVLKNNSNITLLPEKLLYVCSVISSDIAMEVYTHKLEQPVVFNDNSEMKFYDLKDLDKLCMLFNTKPLLELSRYRLSQVGFDNSLRIFY